MANRIFNLIKLSPLWLLCIGGTLAQAQNLPPFAGTRCSHFATQQEAQWHYNFGTAPASLDDNRNGWACEHLTTRIRQDGNRIFNNQVIRPGEVYTLEIWRVHTTDHYLRIKSRGGLDFTTRSFSSGTAAREHMETYYRSLLY
jgi:hypothetical protein